jgi:hypothetical protein
MESKSVEAEVLLRQLGGLGIQLSEAVNKLADMDVLATGNGIAYQTAREEYEDQLAEAFRRSNGSSVDARKADARLQCRDARKLAEEASAAWERSKSRLRSQQAVVRTITTRIEVGRSLLSHEKALMNLGG